jgi:hypothetical protein
LNNVWRLGILPEAPAQGEHKVKEPRRDSREQVQAEQKAVATERTAPGQPRFHDQPSVIFLLGNFLTWRSPARLLPNLQEP